MMQKFATLSLILLTNGFIFNYIDFFNTTLLQLRLITTSDRIISHILIS